MGTGSEVDRVVLSPAIVRRRWSSRRNADPRGSDHSPFHDPFRSWPLQWHRSFALLSEPWGVYLPQKGIEPPPGHTPSARSGCGPRTPRPVHDHVPDQTRLSGASSAHCRRLDFKPQHAMEIISSLVAGRFDPAGRKVHPSPIRVWAAPERALFPLLASSQTELHTRPLVSPCASCGVISKRNRSLISDQIWV